MKFPVFLVLSLGPFPVVSFLRSPQGIPQTVPCWRGVETLLEGKKGKKSVKRTQSPSASGFGKAIATKKKVNDDYAIFPALEPEVQQTLVKAPSILSEEAGVLPEEIYDRLDQIYGFSRFNYNQEDRKGSNDHESPTAAPQLELADLISSVVSEPSEPTRRQDFPLTASPLTKPGSINLDRIPAFTDFRVLHVDPLVLSIENFFSPEECEIAIQRSNMAIKSRSPTVGKDDQSRSQRTSTTWYHHFKEVPELMSKATRLLGLKSIGRWEEPQTVRYRRNEKFTWHLDALGPDESTDMKGGQRVATLLVYLTDLEEDDGGATEFRDLGEGPKPLSVRPQKGSALLFFPAAGGIPNSPFDIRTLHCGQQVAGNASQDKWIMQLWLRQGEYTPTAPPGNSHSEATEEISKYCASFGREVD